MTAIYDFEAQAEGDLSFRSGDRIELVKKTESQEDWWTGRLNGQEGIFPGKKIDFCEELTLIENDCRKLCTRVVDVVVDTGHIYFVLNINDGR